MRVGEGIGGPHTTCEAMGGPCYALVRCGEGMGEVAVVQCM